MTEGLKLSGLRAALLLGALVAGGLTTQLVPTYKEAARTVTYKTKPASVSKSNNNVSNGVSGADVKLSHSARDRGAT